MRILWTLWACTKDGEPTGDSADETPLDTDGACGAVSEVDLSITGGVVDAEGRPLPGAQVWLEERNWKPGQVHGEGTADGAGRFAFDAFDLPVVEGCWGSAVSYWLVGETGTLWGEKPMNPGLSAAVESGATTVDLGAFPLSLE